MGNQEREELFDIVNNYPELLLGIKNIYHLEYINSLLPFSVGFEIECNYSSVFNVWDFKKIPNIMAVSCDSDEQRFRIPPGINGILCLLNISEALKVNSELNHGSGIHYHIGIGEDNYKLLTQENIKENKEWMLEELDYWKYAGLYNARNIALDMSHSWIRCQGGFKTMECRIGEMTFEYSVLIKRILHLSSIIRKFVININGNIPEVEDKHISNINDILEYRPGEEFVKKGLFLNLEDLERQRKELYKEESKEEDEDELIKAIIKRRIVK